MPEWQKWSLVINLSWASRLAVDAYKKFILTLGEIDSLWELCRPHDIIKLVIGWKYGFSQLLIYNETYPYYNKDSLTLSKAVVNFN